MTEKKEDIKIQKETRLADVLKMGSKCDRSGHCCKYGSGFVIAEDIPRIAKYLNISKEEFKEKFLDEHESFNTKHHRLKQNRKKGRPYGPCVFLGDDNLCKIHDVKPLHCRVGSCCHKNGQDLSIWFMLNHFVDPEDPESIRQWAVYLKTQPTIKGGELKDLVKDKKKLDKILSYEILRKPTR